MYADTEFFMLLHAMHSILITVEDPKSEFMPTAEKYAEALFEYVRQESKWSDDYPDFDFKSLLDAIEKWKPEEDDGSYFRLLEVIEQYGAEHDINCSIWDSRKTDG